MTYCYIVQKICHLFIGKGIEWVEPSIRTHTINPLHKHRLKILITYRLSDTAKPYPTSETHISFTRHNHYPKVLPFLKINSRFMHSHKRNTPNMNWVCWSSFISVLAVPHRLPKASCNNLFISLITSDKAIVQKSRRGMALWASGVTAPHVKTISIIWRAARHESTDEPAVAVCKSQDHTSRRADVKPRSPWKKRDEADWKWKPYIVKSNDWLDLFYCWKRFSTTSLYSVFFTSILFTW